MKLSDKDILYLDNHIVVAIKPKGIPTQPDTHNEVSFEDLVKEYLKKRLNKSRVFLHPIFRLDKPVSGIVVFAKTSKALSRLLADQREKKYKKIYLAEVEGTIKNKKGTLRHFIKKQQFHAKVFSTTVPGSKEAILNYEVIKEIPTTIRIELITGRYHQIRAQLSFIGHPIIGDEKYGSTIDSPLKLCHQLIEIVHPVTKQNMTFSLDPSIGNR